MSQKDTPLRSRLRRHATKILIVAATLATVLPAIVFSDQISFAILSGYFGYSTDNGLISGPYPRQASANTETLRLQVYVPNSMSMLYDATYSDDFLWSKFTTGSPVDRMIAYDLLIIRNGTLLHQDRKSVTLFGTQFDVQDRRYSITDKRFF